MFCSNCGAKNNDGAKFCFSCGKPLQAPTPVEKVETPAPAPVEPVAPVFDTDDEKTMVFMPNKSVETDVDATTAFTPVAPVYNPPVVEQPVAPVYNPPVAPATPVYAPVEPVAPAPAPAPEKPKKNKTNIIIIAVVAVIAVAAIVVAILFGTGVIDLDSKETTTEETESRKKDKTESTSETAKDEEKEEERPKGDKNHDGRLIGMWKGTETVEMEGVEIPVVITYTFNENGTFVSEFDVEQYKDALYSGLLEIYITQFGFSETDVEVFFEESMGMTLEEYVEQSVKESKIEEGIKGTWTTDGSNLTLTTNEQAESGVDSDVCEYSFSSDEETFYYTNSDSTAKAMGEFTRQ